MSSQHIKNPDKVTEAGLLKGWEAAAPKQRMVNNEVQDEHRGISRKTFSREEMLRIQRQWENYEHQSMIIEPAYPDEKERGSGVFGTVGKLWTRYRKYAQREELKRKVEEQRFILQLEAARLRNEQEIMDMRNEAIRNLTDEDNNFTDAAPKRYREALSKTRRDHPVATDLNIHDPTLSSTGIGMAVQFDIQQLQSEPSPQEEMINDISIQEEPPSESPFSPYILPKEIMVKIACRALPSSLLFSRWTRLYSLARDGDSFETMLRLVKDNEKTLLVIRSTKGEVFGGFADTVWQVQHRFQEGGKFYGGGQSVLYRVIRQKGEDGQSIMKDVKVYKWTGLNRFCQLCDHEKKMLAMGGGGEGCSFGLCVEDDFTRGSTGRCETFSNESLLGDGGEDFEILDVEVWGFITGIF